MIDLALIKISTYLLLLSCVVEGSGVGDGGERRLVFEEVEYISRWLELSMMFGTILFFFSIPLVLFSNCFLGDFPILQSDVICFETSMLAF